MRTHCILLSRLTLLISSHIFVLVNGMGNLVGGFSVAMVFI
jgi:hypothetical protein